MRNEQDIYVEAKSTMYEAVLNSKTLYPKRTACLYMHHKYNYKHLIKRVNQFASALIALGVKKGDAVTVCLPNIPDAIYLVLAINQIGAINNILHPLSNAHQLKANMIRTHSKIAFVLSLYYQQMKVVEEETGFKVISSSPAEDLPKVMQLLFNLKTRKMSGKISKDHSTHAFYSYKEYQEYDKEFESDAFYLHSSGTSGEPKTVALSNHALNGLVANGSYFLSITSAKNKGMLAVLPMFHGFGLGMGVQALLAHAGVIVLMPKFSAKDVLKYMKKGQIQFLIGVPILYESLLSKPKFHGKILQGLTHAFIGGDFVPKSLIDRFNQRMIEGGSTCRLREGYGLTETVNVCAVNVPGADKYGTVGRPIPNVKFKIVDKNGKEVKPNVDGELLIAGETLMNGYRFNDNEKINDETFIIDENGERWIKTGDFCSIDEDGYLTYKQRIKRIIKVSGINVFPSAIEGHVAALDFVYEAAAIGVDDEKHGHMIKLFVVLNKHSSITEADAIEAINKVIVDNCGIYSKPKEIVFMKSLPHTMVGKIDTKVLK